MAVSGAVCCIQSCLRRLRRRKPTSIEAACPKERGLPDGARQSVAVDLAAQLNRYRQKDSPRWPPTARGPGKVRSVSPEVLAFAVELKCEQPRRSHRTLNRFIKQRFGVAVPKSTLYRHLRAAGATRLKLAS